VTPTACVHIELTNRIGELERRGGGTLDLPDGIYDVDRPLRLPRTVSLRMAPHAVIRALPGFEGEAVVVKAVIDKDREIHAPSGWIRGGVIDGNKLPVTGLLVDGGSRLEISELEVRNATMKGIHTRGWYEVNLHNVRCNVDLDVRCPEGSIGLHIGNGDSIIHTAMVIGYEVGVRSDGGCCDFSGVHVWNYDPTHGPMNYCFYCNGEGDTYVQCYADSPKLVGFYVAKPFQRLIANRVYYSRFQADKAGVGVFIAPTGTRGCYMGNFYFGDAAATLDKAYDGCMDDATILGDIYPFGVVHRGKECRIPSQNGDRSGFPHLHVAGTAVQLDGRSTPPAPEEGAVGDIAWVDEPGHEALFIKTSRGWMQSRLEGGGRWKK